MKIRYLGINLTKEVKDLYSKKITGYQRKKNEEEIKMWKHIPCLLIGRISIIKMSILPKAIYRLNIIPIKILMAISQIWNKYSKNLHGSQKDPE